MYVIGSLEVGGAERHLVQVSTGLKQNGYLPEVFVLTPGGPLTEQLQGSGIPIHGYTPPVWLSRVLRHPRLYAWVVLGLTACTLLAVLWRRRPHVVHFFLPSAYVIGGLVSLWSRVPARIMSRRSLNFYQRKHRLFTRIERFLHPRMSLVCANSKAVAAQLIEEGIRPESIRLIYNGVSLDRDDSDVVRDPDAKRLLFVVVANLIPYKGHDDLLDAFAAIRERLPHGWELWCVGRDDGIGVQLRQRATDLGIGEQVKFLGSRSDVREILSQASVGILCSHQEGFSNAVLEGMAAGLPMVVTNVGGNAEAVVDGETGYVVPARAPAELGRALLAVAGNPRRAEMGARGRRRAEELFSIDACLHQYESLYREVAPAYQANPRFGRGEEA